MGRTVYYRRSGTIGRYACIARIPAQVLNGVQIPASAATEVAATTDATTTTLVDPNEYPHDLLGHLLREG